MKKVPARFVGEFNRLDIVPALHLTREGDIALVQSLNGRQMLHIRCALCMKVHHISIKGSEVSWDWHQPSVTVSPSVRVTFPPVGVCHFNITNGEFIMHSDSTTGDLNV